MALGAVTLVKAGVVGDMRFFVVDVVPSSGANYTTNGETFDVAQIPGCPSTSTLLGVDVTGASSVGGNLPVLQWDATNKKLKAYGTAGSATGLTEIAAATNLSTVTARAICYTR